MVMFSSRVFSLAAFTFAVGKSVATNSIEFCDTFVLDFDALSAGTIVSDQFAGVTVLGESQGGTSGTGNNDAMIFDTNNPTGGDSDLSFTDRGNILILSEDGDSTDPDDNAGGGLFTIDFDEPVRLEDAITVDNENGFTFTLKDMAGQTIGSPVVVNGLGNAGDGTQALIDLGSTEGVKKLEVDLNGSGGIDDLKFTLQCVVPDDDLECGETISEHFPSNQASTPPVAIEQLFDELPPTCAGKNLDITPSDADASFIYSLDGQTDMTIDASGTCSSGSSSDGITVVVFSRQVLA